METPFIRFIEAAEEAGVMFTGLEFQCQHVHANGHKCESTQLVMVDDPSPIDELLADLREVYDWDDESITCPDHD